MSDPKPLLGLDPPDIETMQRMTPSELAREARWTAYKSSLAVFLELARKKAPFLDAAQAAFEVLEQHDSPVKKEGE